MTEPDKLRGILPDIAVLPLLHQIFQAWVVAAKQRKPRGQCLQIGQPLRFTGGSTDKSVRQGIITGDIGGGNHPRKNDAVCQPQMLCQLC